MILTDEKANRDIVDQLYWDARVDANDVKVEVRSGNAILTGTVPSLLASRAAEQDAWKVDGVVSVENHLRVRLAEDIASRMAGVAGIKNLLTVVPGRKIEDAIIAGNVVAALDRNSHIDVEAVDVQVKDGFVTLRGEVLNRTAAEAAYYCALHTEGVIGIRNDLIVRPG